MREVAITDKVLYKCVKKAQKLGRLRNSITKGEGNIAGYVGEEIAKQVLKAKSVDSYDYDLVLANGETVDVKTKRTVATPLEHYVCTVANFNTRQKCKYYAFVRVLRDFSKAWFCGIITKERFFKEATFMKKGAVDDGYVCKADCYNIPISSLDKAITI